jgi:hypothetical protein
MILTRKQRLRDLNTFPEVTQEWSQNWNQNLSRGHGAFYYPSLFPLTSVGFQGHVLSLDHTDFKKIKSVQI